MITTGTVFQTGGVHLQRVTQHQAGEEKREQRRGSQIAEEGDGGKARRHHSGADRRLPGVRPSTYSPNLHSSRQPILHYRFPYT